MKHHHSHYSVKSTFLLFTVKVRFYISFSQGVAFLEHVPSWLVPCLVLSSKYVFVLFSPLRITRLPTFLNYLFIIIIFIFGVLEPSVLWFFFAFSSPLGDYKACFFCCLLWKVCVLDLDFLVFRLGPAHVN